MNIQDKLDLFLPQACAWAEQQEQRILKEGISLTEAGMADAVRIGVRHPERVRLLRVREVPMPKDADLLAAANGVGLFFSQTAGMAVRYGIFLRSDLGDDRMTLIHELTHTAQCERLGGFHPFLQQYLTECLTAGYLQSALEREAIAITNMLQ